MGVISDTIIILTSFSILDYMLFPGLYSIVVGVTISLTKKGILK